jgi:hypothetical protein
VLVADGPMGSRTNIGISSWCEPAECLLYCSVVGIVPRIHDPRFDCRQGQEISLFFKVFGPALRPTQTPIHCLPEIKRPGPELDHYVLLAARLRIGGSSPPYAFMA